MINDEQPTRVASKIRRAVRDLSDPLIVVVGAAYKPNVSDVRESPATEIVEMLAIDGYRVQQYDPRVKGLGYESLPCIAEGADCLVILVEHDEVRADLAANHGEIESAMRHPMILRFYVEENRRMAEAAAGERTLRSAS